MGKRLTFIFILILLLILAFAVFIKGSYTVLSPHRNTSQTTDNWVTYTNSKYNYTIKYPSGWEMEVDGIAVWQDDVPNPELGTSIMFFKSETVPYGQTARGLWNIYVFVGAEENLPGLSPREYYANQLKRYATYGEELSNQTLEDVEINGLNGIKISTNSDDGYSYLLSNSDTIYVLSFSFDKFEGGEFPQPPEEIFSKMVDSFTVGN